MTVELKTATGEFDQDPVEGIETEKKFFLEDKHAFDYARRAAGTIILRRLYLSNARDVGSLRATEATTQKGTKYSATYKTRGRVVPNGIRRRETPTPISQDAFAFFDTPGQVQLTQERAELIPNSGITIDWIDGYDEPILEIEDIGTNPIAQEFYQQHRSLLVDRTGELDVDKEHIAHELSGSKPGIEQLSSQQYADKIVAEALAFHEALGMKQLVITIGGRSGSGKSTVAKSVEHALTASRKFPGGVRLLRTDDYHRGRNWLVAHNNGPWQNWDEPIVYDTKTMALDVWSLLNGRSVEGRYFDFETQEPRTSDSIRPADVVIIEGIHAGSPDLRKVRSLHFQIETSFATSLGRDLDRIRKAGRANDSIGSPAERLRYQFEHAEPTYQSLEKPVNVRQWPAYAPRQK